MKKKKKGNGKKVAVTILGAGTGAAIGSLSRSGVGVIAGAIGGAMGARRSYDLMMQRKKRKKKRR